MATSSSYSVRPASGGRVPFDGCRTSRRLRPQAARCRPGRRYVETGLAGHRIATVLALVSGLLFAGGGFPGGPGHAAAQGSGGASVDAVGVLERAGDRFSSLRGFCARFDQVVRNDILRRTFESHGELCQARPDRFAMHFADPAGDRVIADGESIWVYFPSTDPGQVFRNRGSAADGRFDLHREFLSDPGERYDPTYEGQETVNGTLSHRLALEPLQATPYRHARIWVGVDDSLIHRLEITEDEGLVRVLDLTEMRLNPSIPAGTFEFEPPEGVQVIVR